LPAVDSAFVNAEYVSANEAEISEADGRRIYVQDIIVTVFDTGQIPVSAIVRYSAPGDTATGVAESAPIVFTITTVELDTTITFQDIRDVMHVPLTIWDYLLYAGITLLVVLLAWFVYRWYRGREGEAESVEEAVPALPPDVVALRALEQLRSESLWQNGRHKEYQSRLTDIIRTYIEHRFHVPALEHPTSEIMLDVAMLGLDTALTTELERVLQTADYCKFAKYVPGSAEHMRGLEFAQDFVARTRAPEADGAQKGGSEDV
jgi:hypothetical protein